MLHSDPTQRTVLGWQIRWVAGLFALLMVAAGAIPAYASDGSDSLLDARHGALHSTAEDERATSGELCVATGEMLGSKTGSETELEEDDLDSSCLPTPIRMVDRRAPDRRPRFVESLPTSRPSPDCAAPRAPPIA